MNNEDEPIVINGKPTTLTELRFYAKQATEEPGYQPWEVGMGHSILYLLDRLAAVEPVRLCAPARSDLLT